MTFSPSFAVYFKSLLSSVLLLPSSLGLRVIDQSSNLFSWEWIYSTMTFAFHGMENSPVIFLTATKEFAIQFGKTRSAFGISCGPVTFLTDRRFLPRSSNSSEYVLTKKKGKEDRALKEVIVGALYPPLTLREQAYGMILPQLSLTYPRTLSFIIRGG